MNLKNKFYEKYFPGNNSTNYFLFIWYSKCQFQEEYMVNYLINEKTIAIRKVNKKTIIYDVDNIRVINKNIKNLLNINCNFYGSSLDGRINSAKKILNIKYRVPFLLDELNNIILIPLNSIRDNHCLYLIQNKIINYEMDQHLLKVICCNKHIFYLKTSKYSFELNNHLKCLKLKNIV